MKNEEYARNAWDSDKITREYFTSLLIKMIILTRITL